MAAYCSDFVLTPIRGDFRIGENNILFSYNLKNRLESLYEITVNDLSTKRDMWPYAAQLRTLG
ncbi:hypothetical protein GCM10020370_51190 [Paenibacillus hodogayensis]